MSLLSMALPTLAQVGETVLSGLITLGEFAVLISVVVFVHEMGHLLVAKAFNVKAEKFSLGFGPKLFGFKLGETEYRLSLLPFGGYVKFAGDNPGEEVKPEDKGRGFLEATPLARGAIAFAGPGANFVFALLLGAGYFLTPHLEPAALVGFIKPGSPAAAAGLQHGDKLLAANGQPLRGFFDLQEKVSTSWGRAVALRIERSGEQREVTVQPALVEEDGPLGVRRSGRIGISAGSRTAKVAVLGPQTPAGLSGLQTFDTVVKLGGQEVHSYEQLLDVLAARLSALAATESVALEATRPSPPPPLPAVGTKADEHAALESPPPAPVPVQALLALPAPGHKVTPVEAEALLGLAPSDLTVARVQPGSAAEAAGLRRGDRIVEAQGKPVVWWDDEVERARLQAGLAPFSLVVLRDGVRVPVTVNQAPKVCRDDAGVEKQVPIFGAFPERTQLRDDGYVSFKYPVGESVRRAVDSVVENGYNTLVGLSRMVTGKLSAQAINGPLGIADITRKMADHGLLAFLALMGWISGNLGLMNLLPVPALDGFHLLSAVVEAVRRRPLSLRFREVATTIGIVLLLSLTAFAFFNDTVRKLDPLRGLESCSSKMG